MPTVIFQHEVVDRAHWLKSPLRAEKFGAVGVRNIRTFVDPSCDNRVGLSVDIEDVDAFVRWLVSDEGVAAAQSDGVVIESMVVLVESGG